jgi:hypothetical protein
VKKVKSQLGGDIDDLEALREQMVKFDPYNTGFMDLLRTRLNKLKNIF